MTRKAAAAPSVPERQSFKHWKDVQPNQWPWKSFSPEEIACRGTGKLVVVKSAMDKLQALRDSLGKPIILNSAYRSPEHNAKVGGEPNSYHKAEREYLDVGVMAFDCSMSNQEPNSFWAHAKKVGFNGRGDYPKQGFMHIDNGPPRRWTGKGQKPFPDAPSIQEQPTPHFDPEKPAEQSQLQTILKPEVIVPVATGIGASGLGAAAGGNGPVAWAIGIAIVAVIIFGGLYMFNRTRNSIAVTRSGIGD